LDEIRPVRFETGFQSYPQGSCLVEFGLTKVLCSACVNDGVPPFLKGAGQGWITAEYGMLPGATHQRSSREASRGKQTGRTLEIQRLIGRSLRSVMEMTAFPDRTVWVDCDVIQADGGTRTASITGSFVAAALAFHGLASKKNIARFPIRHFVAGISVGCIRGEKMLDLRYDEDSTAEVDLNVVMTDDGRFVELQGTAEQNPFSKGDLDGMLSLAAKGLDRLFALQREALPFDPSIYGL
jgi:ribonuclease PH